MAVPIPNPFSIGAVLSHTVAVLVRNLPAFVVLTVIMQTAAYLAGRFIGADLFSLDLGDIWLGIIVSTFGYSLLSAMVSYGTYHDMMGKSVSAREMLAQGFARTLSVFVTVVLVATIYTVGTLVFMMPGFIANVILWVALPVAVIERLNVLAALRRSIALTKDKWWHIAGLLATLSATFVVIIIVIRAFQSGPSDIPSVGEVAIQFIGGVFLLFWAVAGAVGYVLLLAHNEGSRRDRIAATFD